MRRLTTMLLAAGLVVVLGCVNIPKKFEAHIVLDIRHHIAEKADDVLDFVEEKTDELPTDVAKPEPDAGATSPSILEWLSPIQTAYAAEMKESSPLMTQILKEMRKRNTQVQELKHQGVAGENNRGYLELRNTDALEAEALNEAQRIVAAENKDRKALHQEIARLNQEEKLKVSTVESIYAQRRLERAKPGEIFQLPPKGEFLEEFKESALGKKLGDECAPEAWVTIK